MFKDSKSTQGDGKRMKKCRFCGRRVAVNRNNRASRHGYRRIKTRVNDAHAKIGDEDYGLGHRGRDGTPCSGSGKVL